MRLYLLSVETIEVPSPATTRLRWRLPNGSEITEDLSDVELAEMTVTPGCPWDCEHKPGLSCYLHLEPGSHYKTLLDYA